MACAVADSVTRETLAVASGSALGPEGVELVCQGGAEIFLGRSMRQFARVWTGVGDLDRGFVREVQVTTANTRQFVAAIPEGWDRLLVLVTDRSVSIGVGWMAVHDGVGRLARPATSAPDPAAFRAAPGEPSAAPGRAAGTHAAAPAFREPPPAAPEAAPVRSEPPPAANEQAPAAREPITPIEPGQGEYEAYEAYEAYETPSVPREPARPAAPEPAPVEREPGRAAHDEPPAAGRPVAGAVERVATPPEPTPVVPEQKPVIERPAGRSFGGGARAGRSSFTRFAATVDDRWRKKRREESSEPEAPAETEQPEDSFEGLAQKVQTGRPRGPRGNMFSRN